MGKLNAINSEKPPLDRWRADAVLEPNRPVWGLAAIAAILGVSDDSARRWVKDPACDVPIRKVGGRWFAERQALLAWRRAARCGVLRRIPIVCGVLRYSRTG